MAFGWFLRHRSPSTDRAFVRAEDSFALARNTDIGHGLKLPPPTVRVNRFRTAVPPTSGRGPRQDAQQPSLAPPSLGRTGPVDDRSLHLAEPPAPARPDDDAAHLPASASRHTEVRCPLRRLSHAAGVAKPYQDHRFAGTPAELVGLFTCSAPGSTFSARLSRRD